MEVNINEYNENKIEEKKDENKIEEKKEEEKKIEEKKIDENKIEDKKEEENKIEDKKEEEKKEENKIEEKKEGKNMKIQDLFKVLVNKQLEIEKIISEKAKEMRDKYNFAMTYSNGISIIINLFTSLLFERLENSFKENSNFFQFFKNIQTIYQSIAQELKNTKAVFKSANQKLSKINDTGLGTVLEKTQNSLSKNFEDLSNSLKNKILSKQSINVINEKYNEIEKLKKEINAKIDKIERRRKKLEKKYTSKYELLFHLFSPQNNLQYTKQIQKPSNLEEVEDFVIIVMDFFNGTNKLILKTNLFVLDIKDLLYKINMVFLEYSDLVKNCVLLYIQENKKIFSQEIIKDLESIEKYYEEISKPNVDQSFRIPKIFDTQKLKDQINSNLKDYQTFLKNSNRVQNEILNNDIKFKIENYVNIEIFFETLISINPQPTNLNISDLIKDKFEIKRDPGMFSSWRECLIMFTKQNHMIIFDKPVNKFFVNIFEINKITYSKKEDKKKPFLFSIYVNQKGKIMNSNGTYIYDALDLEKLKKIEGYFNIIEGSVIGEIKK
jgi:hypothetical protein